MSSVNLKSKMFTVKIQSDPPKAPVKLYHWINFGVIENAFPSVNHG